MQTYLPSLRPLFVAAALAAGAANALATQAVPVAPGITGKWATKGFGSIVELHPCADAPQALCGRITWLWDALDEDGAPRQDEENPERELRSRPLVGIQILKDFKETSPGVWTDGDLYNPDDGETYSGSIRLVEPGRLELEGCALGVLCESQTWYRPEIILAHAVATP